MTVVRTISVLAGMVLATVIAGASALASTAHAETPSAEDAHISLSDLLEPLESIISPLEQDEDADDDSEPTVARAAGPERIATAVAASAAFRVEAHTAVLATALDFPDALAATALAARADAPLLLTTPDELPERVSEELERLGVERTVLLGGRQAISESVAGELDDQGFAVDRIAGRDRFETAAELALAAGSSETGEVLVALGAHSEPNRAWPDAVAGGALAASPDRVPTVLTAPDHLPSAAAQALEELDADRALVIGGESAISRDVIAEIESLGLDTERVAGSNRYHTSALLAEDALARAGDGARPIVLATGEDFPDALAAGALAGAWDAPLALTPSDELASVIGTFVRDHADALSGGVVVGGSSAASDLVVDQLRAALRDAPRPEPDPDEEPDAVDDTDDGDTDDGDTPEDGSAEDEAAEDDPEVARVFEGEASWYGSDFHGQTTACGDTYDMHDLTAAHRELPCGTHVRVTNTENGRQVTVRINDRGPFADNRVLDVSKAAAEQLGMRAAGTAWVRGEILDQ